MSPDLPRRPSGPGVAVTPADTHVTEALTCLETAFAALDRAHQYLGKVKGLSEACDAAGDLSRQVARLSHTVRTSPHQGLDTDSLVGCPLDVLVDLSRNLSDGPLLTAVRAELQRRRWSP